MADPQILLLGQDLYADGRVISYPSISEQKSFGKDKLITNTYEIRVRNEDDYFSINNPKSIFNKTNWLYAGLQAKGTSEETIWDGILTRVPRNHANKEAILQSKNSLFQYRNETVEYESSTWETGADVIINIASDIDFTNINENAIQTSKARLTAANCYLKANINKSDNMTFQKIIEKMAEYSNADAYSHYNEVYFVHWIPFVGGVSVNLEESDLKTFPDVVEDEREIINDYNIDYDESTTPATDANSNNIGSISRARHGVKSLPEMQSGTGEQITLKDKVSAIYLGEGYIKRTVKNYATQPDPLSRIEFELFADQKQWINLQTYFRQTLSDEGWTDKIFEVFQFSIDEDNDSIKATAYEVIT